MTTPKNFVNFHVLISHSPSCLNRDDMNMQKVATFGGVNRVRISSQSLKRAMRKSDYYCAQFGAPSIRTRELELLIPQFTEKLGGEFPADLIARTMELFVRASEENKSEGSEDQEENSAETEKKKLAVAPWSLEEIRHLCRLVQEVKLTEDEMSKIKEKAAKQKGKGKKTEQALLEEALTEKRKKPFKPGASKPSKR